MGQSSRPRDGPEAVAGRQRVADGRRQPVAGFRQALRRVVHVAGGRRHAVDAGQAGAVSTETGFVNPR